MAKYINTKETAVLIRQALKASFPTTKFSVRKGTGTAATWIDISWTDGPTIPAVEKVANVYRGTAYNGLNGEYEPVEKSLIAFENGELPEVVSFGVSGILTHRTMGEEGKQAALNVLIENNRTVAIVDENGDYNKKLNRDYINTLYSPGHNIANSYDLPNAVWRIFYHTDMAKVPATK